MKEKSNTKRTTLWICLTAMFMALNVAMSSFGVPVPGGHLYLNDIILGDLFFYPLPMFVSLVTHGLQAVIISVFSHYVLKKHPVLASGIGVSIGAVIMVVGYSLGRAFIYSTPEYALMKLPFQILQAVVGAVVGMLLCWKCGVYKLYNKALAKTSGGKREEHKEPAEKS